MPTLFQGRSLDAEPKRTALLGLVQQVVKFAGSLLTVILDVLPRWTADGLI